MARDFNGSTDLITIGDVSAIDITGTALTLACWFQIDTKTAGKVLIGKWDNATAADQYLLSVGGAGNDVLGGNIGDGLGATDSVSDTVGLNTGQWYHAALVKNGTGADALKLYLNGVQVDSVTSNVSIGNTAMPLYIGAMANGAGQLFFHDGKIASVAIYNVAKTAAEIGQIMRSGPPASMTGLQGWWELHGFLSPEQDFSGNNNKGTLTGTANAAHPSGLAVSWPYVVAVGAEGAATGNITLGAPSATGGNLTNDVWIATVHSSDNNAHTFTDWTQITQANGSGATSRLSTWYFRYAGSNPGLLVGHTAGQTCIGGIVAVRNCRPSGSPVNATGSTAAGVTDATIDLLAVTPTAQNTLVLACDGSADDNDRTTPPTGFHPHLDEAGSFCYKSTIGNPDGSVAIHSRFFQPAASTGAFVDTQAASDAWASVLIALESDLFINVADALTVGETVTVTIPVSGTVDISVTDGLTIGETVTLILDPKYVSVTDGLIIGETTTLSVDGVLAPTINLSDGLTLGEVTPLLIACDINLSDNLTMADSPVFLMSCTIFSREMVLITD